LGCQPPARRGLLSGTVHRFLQKVIRTALSEPPGAAGLEPASAGVAGVPKPFQPVAARLAPESRSAGLPVDDEDRHRPKSESACGSGSKRLLQQAGCTIGRANDDSVRPLHEERICL
jgi:hypothetical protein